VRRAAGGWRTADSSGPFVMIAEWHRTSGGF
jgi:hypothetical protein